jgi:ethanolamine utilization protein EutQ (cupin superfamily)
MTPATSRRRPSVSTRTVANAAYHPEQVTVRESVPTEDRHKGSPLTKLGPAFMVCDETSMTPKWPLHYEEVLCVVSGELTLTVHADAETHTIAGRPGDILAIAKDSALTYAGTKGAQVFVVSTALNVEDPLEASGN